MQEKYLFRGKRIDNGEWVIGNCIDDGVTGQVFIHVVGNSVNESDKVGEEGCLQFVAFEVAPSTICQCTGLKDKNGNLIWENDIVKDDQGNLYKVFWQEKYYQFSWVCVKSEKLPVGAKWNLNCFRGYEMEIISNVFDNPELLEG